MHVRNLCKFVKTGLLINLWNFFMRSSALIVYINNIIWCGRNFMRPALDSHNSHEINLAQIFVTLRCVYCPGGQLFLLQQKY